MQSLSILMANDNSTERGTSFFQRGISMGEAIGFMLTVVGIIITQWINMQLNIRTMEVQNQERWNQIQEVKRTTDKSIDEIKASTLRIENNVQMLRIEARDERYVPKK